MAGLLTDVGAFVTAGISWVGDIVEYVVSEPILLIGLIGIPLMGFAVGIIKRLLSL